MVLFHNQRGQYGLAMHSFLDGCDGVLHVVDNSAHPLAHTLFQHPRIVYTFAGRNLGFGAGHNLALAQLGERDGDESDAHLLLNPDVRFDAQVLTTLTACLQADASIGAVMPKIAYPDGKLQRLCKLLPTPFDLILRRFIPSTVMRDLIHRRYEMHLLPQDLLSDVLSLSGCFLLVRTTLLRRLGGFDERYFIYMENMDLVRRIGDQARTVYEPTMSVTHAYAMGSYRNKKLLAYHLTTAIRYFKKWGWVRNRTRSARNRRAFHLLKAG